MNTLGLSLYLADATGEQLAKTIKPVKSSVTARKMREASLSAFCRILKSWLNRLIGWTEIKHQSTNGKSQIKEPIRKSKFQNV